MTSQEIGSQVDICREKPEALKRHYAIGVIIPYSSDIHPKTKEPDLSLFSKIALSAAFECYQDGVFDKFLLCGEQTFGPDKKSTSDLMREKLMKLGVPEENIQLLSKTDNLNNTVYQIKALAQYQQVNPDSSLLIIDYNFHDPRIKNHMEGFGLVAKTISVQEVAKYYWEKEPNKPYLRKFDGIFNAFEARERMLRFISRGDRKGIVPRFLNQMHGASVNNIEVTKTEEGQKELRFVNTTAKKRQRQMATSRS